MIIGMVGKAGTGKDTAARILCDDHGYRRLSFADAVRAYALHIDPPIGQHWLSGLVAADGWEHTKQRPAVRQLLQNIGQGARNIDPTIWVKPVEQQIVTANNAHNEPRIVVTDVRYLNEAGMIRWHGGYLWRIERPFAGLDGTAGTHLSETELDGHPTQATLTNDSSISALAYQIRSLLDNTGTQ